MVSHVFDLVQAQAIRLGNVLRRNVLAMAFLFLVFPLGLFICFITPTGRVPDETAHEVRAYALLHGEFVGERQSSTTPDGRIVVNAGVFADPAMVWANIGPGNTVDAGTFILKWQQDWTGLSNFININPLAVYFPIFYVPSAVGLGVAKLGRMSPYEAICVARFFSYICYTCLSVTALLLTRRGAALLFIALAMPMTLSLGASCNPDGLLIATTAVAVALITRNIKKYAVLCLAAVILVKPPYAPMAAALLLPLPAARAWLKQRWALLKRLGLALLTVLPGALWFIYTMLHVSAPNPHPAYHPGPLWPGDPNVTFYATDPAAQLAVLAAHPLGSIALVWHDLMINPWLIKEMIGLLGYQSVVLPPFLYLVWKIAALGALLASLAGRGDAGAKLFDILLIGFAIALSVYLVWISQYLNWTRVGLNSIDGPGGRYLLPLIPLLALALPQLQGKYTAMVRMVGTGLPILAAALTLILLPEWLVLHYYVLPG